MPSKYPDIHVQLSDEDGNAFVIIARIRRALREAGINGDEIESFATEAMSGDYDNVLATAGRWVAVS